MYFYWEESSSKTCPTAKDKCKGPDCPVWRWTKLWSGKIIKAMPRDDFDLKILPHMIGYCGLGTKPTDKSLEPWNTSRSPGHFRPYNP